MRSWGWVSHETREKREPERGCSAPRRAGELIPCGRYTFRDSPTRLFLSLYHSLAREWLRFVGTGVGVWCHLNLKHTTIYSLLLLFFQSIVAGSCRLSRILISLAPIHICIILSLSLFFRIEPLLSEREPLSLFLALLNLIRCRHSVKLYSNGVIHLFFIEP